jgi:hypothetical protein
MWPRLFANESLPAPSIRRLREKSAGIDDAAHWRPFR